MPQRLTIARIASGAPMGAEGYQAQIIRRAPTALEKIDTVPWTTRELIVRSLRSPLSGNRRLPLSRVSHASPAARRRLGRWLYAGDAVTHRMNLELPPSPHADVVTLHDVVAWRFPDESAPVRAAGEELRRAAAVICVSAFSAQEATDLLGIRNAHVVHNGVDERFFDASPLGTDERRRLGLERPYVLHTGGTSERKNLAGLAEAWRLVHQERPDLLLALAGPAHPRRTDLFAGMPGALLLGRVDDGLMPGLIAAAEAIIVPSHYEGFGLPVLEGMAAGVPVVAARTSSLPEVAGSSGVLVDPGPEGIAEGILYATSDDPALAKLVTSGRAWASRFTWERSAEEHARVWTSIR